MDKLNKQFRLLSISYLIIWVLIIVEAIFLFHTFRAEVSSDWIGSGKNFIIANTVFFILGLIAVTFASIVSLAFQKQLKANNIRGGMSLFISFVILYFPVLCTGNIFGGSIAIAMNGPAAALSGISLLVFELFPILTYIGLNKCSTPVSGKRDGLLALKNLKNSSLALMIVMLIFSPLFMTMINSTPETPVLPFNIVFGVAYGITLGFFFCRLIKLWNVADLNISQKPEVIYEYRELDDDLKKGISTMGSAYLYLWSAILISAIFMYLFYSYPGVATKVLTYVAYAGSWVAVYYGLKSAGGLSSRLRFKNRWLVPASVAVLVVTSLLSLNSIFGANFWIDSASRMHEVEHRVVYTIGDKTYTEDGLEFDPSSFARMNEDPFGSVMTKLGGIAMFIFTLFPVLTYIATYKMSRYVPELKKALTGALILLIASVVFSPLLITSLVLQQSQSYIILYLVCLVVYGTGTYLFVRPWASCQTVRTDLELGETPQKPEVARSPRVNSFDFSAGKEKLSRLKERLPKKYIAYGLGGIVVAAAVLLALSWFDFNETEVAEELDGEKVSRLDEERAALAEKERMEEERNRLEAQRQDSIAREKEKIAKAMPTPQMFGSNLSDESGGSLRDVSYLRNYLPSIGYERISNNKFVLKEGGSPKVTVLLDYQEWEGEYIPEIDEYEGAGMSYDINLTFSDPSEAKAFYRSWERMNRCVWLSAYLNGSTVTLNAFGD